MAQLVNRPAATLVNRRFVDTRVGALREIVVPSPTWLRSLRPQQYSTPARVRPQVCPSPTATMRQAPDGLLSACSVGRVGPSEEAPVHATASAMANAVETRVARRMAASTILGSDQLGVTCTRSKRLIRTPHAGLLSALSTGRGMRRQPLRATAAECGPKTADERCARDGRNDGVGIRSSNRLVTGGDRGRVAAAAPPTHSLRHAKALISDPTYRHMPAGARTCEAQPGPFAVDVELLLEVGTLARPRAAPHETPLSV